MLRTDRRLTPRTKLNRLAYIQIQPNNGGIVLNVSSGGLCLHSIAPVEPNAALRLLLIEQNRRIAVSAEHVWTDQAQKVAGLAFTTLTDEARQQIQNWMEGSSPPAEDENSSAMGSVLRRALPSLATIHFREHSATRRRIRNAAARLRLRTLFAGSGFSGGLATGFLLSALVCSTLFFCYAHRFQMGEELIRWGERLTGKAAKSSANAQLSAAPPQAAELEAAKLETSTGRTASSRSERPAAALQATPANVRERAPRRHKLRLSSAHEKAAKSPHERHPPALAGSSHPDRTVSDTPQPLAIFNNGKVSGFRFDSSVGLQRSPFTKPLPVASAAPEHENAARKFTASSPLTLPSKGGTNETRQMYFELGRFKEASLAQSLADKLSQAGFHTTVREKGRLWLNRYQVLVGPYSQEEETAKAEHELVSRGYKPRSFERGSRSFMFSSSLLLNGTRLPGGDFTITWESYLTHAMVKFMQGNAVRTTMEARWVQRGKRYLWNEFVYLKNPDGSRTLVELHFSGLDQALAFSNKS